jgi:hypothetical protein
MALMTLMDDEISRALPSMGSTEHLPEGQRMVQFKYFDPCGSWTWYAMEFDAIERRFYGLVDGMALEYGYWMLHELEKYEGPLGIGIERDTSWTPKTARSVFKDCLKRRGGNVHG